jgi:hypothetical protein
METNEAEGKPAVRSERLLDALDAEETRENRADDVSPLLTPEQRLWAILYHASGSHGGYDTEGVCRWWWRGYGKECPNMDCLTEAFDEYLKAKASNAGTERRRK